MRIALAALLVAHGLIHSSYLVPAPAVTDGPPWPFSLDRSWLLRRLGMASDHMMALGRAITIASVAGLVLSGVGVLAGASWWLPVTIVAAAVSLAQLVVWFHWWLPVGIAIDVALLVALGGGLWAPSGLPA